MQAKNNSNQLSVWIKNIFHSFTMVVNGVVILMFILAAYSGWVDPSRSILLSYLGLGFPVIALLNILFVVYWLFISKWKQVFVCLASFLICLGPIETYFPLHFRQTVPEGKNVIKVLSYNVMSFAYMKHTKKDPNPIVSYLAASGADIICLQEYSNYISQSVLNKALKMYPYRKVMSQVKRNSNIAIYSKYPILKSYPIKYKSLANSSSVHLIKFKDKKITLINNHLESFKLTTEDKTKYSDFMKNMSTDKFESFKQTINSKLGPAFRIRAKQAQAVADEIKDAKGDYVVVCGDFNDTPISYAHRTIQQSLLDAFSESGRGLGISYNQNFFFFRIDYILHSKNIKSFNCTVDNSIEASDHYPIWSYLQLN